MRYPSTPRDALGWHPLWAKASEQKGLPCWSGSHQHARKPGASTELAAQRHCAVLVAYAAAAAGLSPGSSMSVLMLGLSVPALAAWANQTPLLSLPGGCNSMAFHVLPMSIPSLDSHTPLLCDSGEGQSS